jgi:hypothetical protein
MTLNILIMAVAAAGLCFFLWATHRAVADHREHGHTRWYERGRAAGTVEYDAALGWSGPGGIAVNVPVRVTAALNGTIQLETSYGLEAGTCVFVDIGPLGIMGTAMVTDCASHGDSYWITLSLEGACDDVTDRTWRIVAESHPAVMPALGVTR